MTQRLTLDLAPGAVQVESGIRVACDCTVTNLGDVPIEVDFRVSGPAGEWSWTAPAQLTLAPGTAERLAVVFRPPPGFTVPAGPMDFGLCAREVSSKAEVAQVHGTLEIAALEHFGATLVPRTSELDGRDPKASAQHDCTVTNRGNAPLDVELVVDDAQGLAITIDPTALHLAPGESGRAKLMVAPSERISGGSSRDLPFTVTARPTRGEPVVMTATVQQRTAGRKVAILPLVAAVIALVLIAIGLRATVFAPVEPTPVGAARTLDLGASTPADDANPAAETVVAAPDVACPAEGHFSGGGGRTFAVQDGQVVGVQEPRRPRTEAPADYGFLFTDAEGCAPIRWDPCTPISYVIDDTAAPPQGVADVIAGMDRIAAATGLEFVYEGIADEPPSPTLARSPYQPERYGQRWVPVLISWQHGGLSSGRDSVEVPGNGYPMMVDGVIVSGTLNLNGDTIGDLETRSPLPSGYGTGVTWGRVILHEIGHIVGLGHVRNPGQILYGELSEQTSPTAEFGQGDLAGLAIAGSDAAGCRPAPPPPDVS